MGILQKKELPTLDPMSIYACQEAAWMDKRCMLIWVEQVLTPISRQPPPLQASFPLSFLTRTDAT